MGILGFPASTGTIGNLSAAGYVEGTQQANLNSLQNILISSDITTGSYMNSLNSNIIASVIPDVTSYSTIIYKPYHPLRLPLINIAQIDQMTITLTDQNGVILDLGSNNGTQALEPFSILIDISTIDTVNLL